MFPLPRFRSGRGDRGVTLVELLIALAVTAVLLASIGGVVASNVRSARSLDGRLALAQTARAISTGLPDRDQITQQSASGQLAGHRWRVDMRDFVASFVDPRQQSPWSPQSILITVQSPTGQTVQLHTVRLRRAGQEAK